MKKGIEIIKVLLLMTFFWGIYYFSKEFLKSERVYYSEIDVENLKENSFWFILILVCFIVILRFFSNFKMLKGVDEVFGFIFNFGFACYFLFSVFQASILGSYLYFNRIIENSKKEELFHSYRIHGMYPYDESYKLRWLYDFESEEIVREDFIVSYEDYMSLNEGDSVRFKFKEGYFGIKHSPEYERK